ncbi:MAG: hypothetical protein QOE92_898 [Chloroflexota bacterium]|jgi:hypothetical protein|nr:hypothetical protein [Chloroflexota bacterium]
MLVAALCCGCSGASVARPIPFASAETCPTGFRSTDPKLDNPGPDFVCVYDDVLVPALVPEIGRQYPFAAHTHCGVVAESFAGRTFWSSGPPRAVPGSSGGENPFGWMTLVDEHHATFRGRTGYEVDLTDTPRSPPGLCH